MVKYTIREPFDKEIKKCINVLYSAFERALPLNIKKEESVWKALIESEIGKFLISEEESLKRLVALVIWEYCQNLEVKELVWRFLGI
jgi:hypothetical protein